MDIQGLITALKATAMTGAQINALDNSYLCQNPAIAVQQIRALGVQMTVTTDGSGDALYKVAT
jgi:hypothetical protein